MTTYSLDILDKLNGTDHPIASGPDKGDACVGDFMPEPSGTTARCYACGVIADSTGKTVGEGSAYRPLAVPAEDPATKDAKGRFAYGDIDDVVKAFRAEIDAFMRGQRPESHRDNADGTLAHIWVSQHYDKNADFRARRVVFETLVIEPHGSGGASQWEVAVRMPGAAADYPPDQTEFMAGYVATTAGLRGRGIDH